MNEATARPLGTGYLVVQVTTGNSAIPLKGASVTVSQKRAGDTVVLYELTTGRDGKAPQVALPAPSRSDAQRAATEPPYATYHIAVALPGYTAAEYNEVPIFDGIIAMQQADLVPLPENRYPDGFTRDEPTLFETTPPAL